MQYIKVACITFQIGWNWVVFIVGYICFETETHAAYIEDGLVGE